MPQKLFSKNLKYLLQQRQITQTEFSRRLKLSHSAATPWIKGICFPKLDTLILMSDVLKVSIDNLVRKDLSKNNLP
jgi:transcriptional regulator with XRE-family HTH domain